MANRNLIDRNKSDALTLAVIGFVIVIAAFAVNFTVIVFAVINGLALFGPDGDISSVWHWVWFIICLVIVLGNVLGSRK